MTLYHSRQNYCSWTEHQLSGAILCSFCIIHLWRIAFCGEPSSYSPVMITALATVCIYTVIQDVLISLGIPSARMSITLIATRRCLSYPSIFCYMACIHPLNHPTTAHKHSKRWGGHWKILYQRIDITPKKSQGDNQSIFKNFVTLVVSHE